jgi:hypothetical protein
MTGSAPAAGEAAREVAVTAERCAAQLLSGPRASDPVDVAERLLAVQGQDPRGARLAVRARTAGLSAADVDGALTADRSLLITWLNRGTLHLVRSADYWWLHQLTTPPLLAGNARRLGQEGVSPDAADRGVRVVERSLERHGPLTRGQLGERISAAGVRTQGQALVHVLMLASLRGVCVRGPMVGSEHAYVLVRDWLGAPPESVDRDRALAMLARRYLAGHGPATDRDLAKWAGLPLRDARRGLTAIASRLGPRDDGLAALAGQPTAGRCRHRGCLARTIRCCSAGRHASRSWARPRESSPSTGSSGRSRSSAAGPPPPGLCPGARSRSHLSAGSPRRTRRPWMTKRWTSRASWAAQIPLRPFSANPALTPAARLAPAPRSSLQMILAGG